MYGNETDGARVILYLGDIPAKEWKWTEANEALAKALVDGYKAEGNDAWWAVVGEE